MAGTSNNINSINQNQQNSGFPPYLDWYAMRTSAINYLGPITGSYWTDYNVHDPGITTLEALIYAILDLGYRTHLPFGSLLAGPAGSGGPTMTSPASFTAGQSFGDNPLTILDYRKLLMDIGEVRNAWLEPDQTLYNGLYRVYLELAKDAADFPGHHAWEAYQTRVRQEVRRRLRVYRNLCEDVQDIEVLDKLFIGVQADLEVVPGTSVATAYQGVVAALYSFFSPVPTFYTLGQLMANNMTPDTIFLGRPYGKRPSHGFLLDEEMPDRSTGIQLSAVYDAIQAVPGLKTIRTLHLLDARGQRINPGDNEWGIQIPSRSIPGFLLSVSSFRWYMNGQLLTTDLSSYNASLERTGRYANKVEYPAGSSALDLSSPPSMTLQGLDYYRSIQNDFPLVYGIGPGGLPADVSALRQSQALQFKAFLLFFDQLLADYVAQLANLAQIFSMSAPTTATTYFRGNLGSVPDLAQLLRFPPQAAGTIGGSALLIPVAVQAWEQILKAAVAIPSGQTPTQFPTTPARKSTGSVPGILGSHTQHLPGRGAAEFGRGAAELRILAGSEIISSASAAALQPYNFSSAVARDTALATVTVLFTGDPPASLTVQQDDGRWRYYFIKVDPDYVLLSQNSFATQADAQGEAATVLYTGQNTDNYTRVSLGEVSQYSFSLTSTTDSYNEYLQDILENKQDYTPRRTLFLQHLLARFAEAFTDYALLEAGFASPGQIAQDQIDGMQNFLGHWPVLSGDRGKGAEFPASSGSGLQQRIYAYCGIPDTPKSILCHFEVYRSEEYFRLGIRVGGEVLFTCQESFSEKQIFSALRGLVGALSDRSAYAVRYDEKTADYGLEVTFYGQYNARSTSRWLEAPAAERAAETSFRLFGREPVKDDIVPVAFECRPRLLNSEEQVVRAGVEGFPDAVIAAEAAYLLLSGIDDEHLWARVDPIPLGGLRRNNYPGLPAGQVMAVSSFRRTTDQDVLGAGKEERWSFEVLDGGHYFRFRSTGDYESQDEAREAADQLLHFLCDRRFYILRRLHGEIQVVIRVDDVDWAEGEPRWGEEVSAGAWVADIIRRTRRHRFQLDVECKPVRWRWLYYLGMPDVGLLRFESLHEYRSPEAAMTAARGWYSDGAHIPGHSRSPLEARLLEAREAALRLMAGEADAERRCLIPIEPAFRGAYLYRLVDKDHPRAFHPEGRHSREAAEELRDDLILRWQKGYRFIELCLGGDNIRLDPPTNYRYLLRCRNDYFGLLGVTSSDRELVLFESGKHYPTEAEAQADFQTRYFEYLRLAADPRNYGEGRPIRIAGAEHGDYPPLLIVPAATSDALIDASLDVVDTLVRATRTYPFREEHHHHHPARYSFVLGPDWKSADSFSSPGEAQETFNDFLLLLNYAGNYFIEIDWAACNYRIGIREVLLESCDRFHDEAEAWGWEGVERCIGVAQTKGGFHLSQRPDCSYTYCVACPNPHVIHPCTYDNAAHRDRALERLRQHPGYFITDGYWLYSGGHRFMLRNGLAHPVAWVPVPDPASEETIVDRIIDIIAAIDRVARPQPFGTGWQLIVEQGPHSFAIDQVEDEPADSWLRKLHEIANYFPVTRDTPLPGHYGPVNYQLVVKLPGFSDPVVPVSDSRDCGCPPVPGGDNLCYAAWIGRAPFRTAWDAWKAWLDILPVLAEDRNYRPVFTEEIGQYGIVLQERKTLVTCNPQHYPYAQVAVDAMERTKARINTEGLHLIEHLLLRNARAYAPIPVCTSPDPCASTGAQPGADPYSFILTVALPAWPARFRTPANRALLESIIQRETPAHILPRILWLTPGNMCRFEMFYRGWADHLRRQAEVGHADIHHADIHHFCHLFDETAFIRFLFEVGSIGPILGSPCEPQRDQDHNNVWLNEINDVYCWGAPVKATVEAPVEVTYEPLVEASDEPLFEAREEPPVEPPEEPESPPPILSPKELRDIRRVQRARHTRYAKAIEAWKKATGTPLLASKSEAFLLDPDPSLRRLEELLTEIHETEAGDPAIRIAKLKSPHLAATALAIFLDRIIEKSITYQILEQLAEVLRRSGHRIGEPDAFYTTWRPDELLPLTSRLDLPRLHKLLKENIHYRP
jgi:hypothetical protein